MGLVRDGPTRPRRPRSPASKHPLPGGTALWLSAIRDAFSRRVVAWQTSAHADAGLVLTSRECAWVGREAARQLVHHAEPGQCTPSSSQHAWSEPETRYPWVRS